MKTYNDGGPAFPESQKCLLPGSNVYQQITRGGMTLRDYFAGQALAGLLSVPDERMCPSEDQKEINEWRRNLQLSEAEICYAYGDAMIAAREAQISHE